MKLALILALIVAFNVWDWRHPLRLALDAIERAEKRRRAGREVWKRVHYLIGRDPGLGHLHTAHDCDQPVPDAWKAPEPIVRRPDPNQEPQW